MSSGNDKSMRNPWDAVLQELHAKGEVPKDVLYDGDAFMQWWKSLDPAKQDVIIGIVREISQGRKVRATPVTSTKERKQEAEDGKEAMKGVAREMVMKRKKGIGLRIILGIAGIVAGLIVQVAGAFFLKVTGLESAIFPALTVILGFMVMGYLVYRWAIR